MARSAMLRWAPQEPEQRTRRTRAFLNTIVPELKRMRPLIEAGIVVPVPSEPLYFQHRKSIDELRRDVTARVPLGPVSYATRFGAAEIATEDNVRGYFAMAPGPDPSLQIQRAIDHGIRYFAREYTLASAHGATYTAPFAHEHFLCAEGISPRVGPSTRVVKAVLHSGLPIFHGLSPKIIEEIHEGDAFAEFRATLHRVYQDTPVEDPEQAALYIRDQENALLTPLVAQGERSASRGLLGRLGATLSGNTYGIAAALAADITLGTVGAATALNAAGTLLDDAIRSRRRPAGSERIWSALVRHHQTVEDELIKVRTDPAPNRDPNWGIPTEPGMTISVTAGQMIWDADPRTITLTEIDENERTRLGVYRPCECGSGRKYRFCCQGLR